MTVAKQSLSMATTNRSALSRAGKLCNSNRVVYESKVRVGESSGGGRELRCAGGVWGLGGGREEEICSCCDVEGLDAVFATAGMLAPLDEGERQGFSGREGPDSRVAQDSWGKFDRSRDDREATLELKPGRRQWRKRGAVSPCAASLGQDDRLRKASWFG